MTHVDFKITTWERVELPEDIEVEVIDAIKAGKIKSANDLFNQFQHDDLFCDNLLDSNEQISLEDNKGYSTIEIEDHNNKIIYKNGKD